MAGKVALFDPQGETGTVLKRLGVACQPVDASSDLSAFDVLIVGKSALRSDAPAPDMQAVSDAMDDRDDPVDGLEGMLADDGLDMPEIPSLELDFDDDADDA